jgi:thiamine biosynthesis lipoprotein
LYASGTETISTSGDYQRYFDYGGVRYHHILDPATGYPATQSVTVTVIGAVNLTDADIYDNTAFILGYQKGLDFLTARGCEAVLVDGEGKVHVTPGLEGRLELYAQQVDPSV